MNDDVRIIFEDEVAYEQHLREVRYQEKVAVMRNLASGSAAQLVAALDAVINPPGSIKPDPGPEPDQVDAIG